MTVYDLNNKELRKEFRKFGKTTFGKVVFCLAYAIPLLSLIVAIEMFVLSKLCICCAVCLWYKPICVIALIFTFVTFILGSRYFYKEFREFFRALHREDE